MATYSTNLALTLIGTGEQSGTWGTTTNTNLGTLLEQAISGYQTQACTGGTDTITIPDGADGVARNMFLELIGTGGGTLVVPAKRKLYFIYNNTALAITVKVTGLTGVSVPAAAKVILVNNGTDVVVATNYMPSLTLGAALPIASGGTAGTTAAAARAALSAAVLGANGDITSLTGLTTPLSVAQGGTGASSTTAYAAIVGNSAGTGFASVAPGTSGNLLTSNGTNWASTAPAAAVSSFSAGTTGFTPSTATTGVVTLAGTLAVANGGTGSTTAAGARTALSAAVSGANGDITSITGLTTALSVLQGGTGVTTSTGTGNVVLSTSPTLVTPALGTPASGVVTNLTGTASININGTVGATTANTGAFTTLTSTSDATIQSLTVGRGGGAILTNTAFGSTALQANTTGSSNVAIGWSALNAATITLGNTAVGSGALSSYARTATSIGRNTAIGQAAMVSSTDGVNNTAVGYGTLSVTTGSGNTALGSGSGNGITTGSYNVILGNYSGSAAPISATGSNYIVLSDGLANVRAYWDGANATFNGDLTVSGTITGSLASATGLPLTTGVTGLLPVANGGTASSTAATARTALSAAGSGAVGSSALTMTTARVLGRTTASTGAIEEITVGSGLTLASGALTSPVKAWVRFSVSATIPTIVAQYNVASVTRNSIGDYTITFTTGMSSVNYSAITNTFASGTNLGCGTAIAYATGNVQINTTNSANNTLHDPVDVNLVVLM